VFLGLRLVAFVAAPNKKLAQLVSRKNPTPFEILVPYSMAEGDVTHTLVSYLALVSMIFAHKNWIPFLPWEGPEGNVSEHTDNPRQVEPRVGGSIFQLGL